MCHGMHAALLHTLSLAEQGCLFMDVRVPLGSQILTRKMPEEPAEGIWLAGAWACGGCLQTTSLHSWVIAEPCECNPIQRVMTKHFNITF